MSILFCFFIALMLTGVASYELFDKNIMPPWRWGKAFSVFIIFCGYLGIMIDFFIK